MLASSARVKVQGTSAPGNRTKVVVKGVKPVTDMVKTLQVGADGGISAVARRRLVVEPPCGNKLHRMRRARALGGVARPRSERKNTERARLGARAWTAA
jgi:hypothetical protein